MVVRFVILVGFVMSGVMVSAKNVKVSSPDGNLMVTVGVKNHQPFYMVNYEGKQIVPPSHLGFQLSNGMLGGNSQMGKVVRSSKDETWVQPWGERDTTRNHYNEMMVSFREQTGRPMQVVFRVFNDGLGFRYILPDHQKGEAYQIMDEQTEITLAHDAKAWSISSNHTEYFEGIYTAGLLSKKDTVGKSLVSKSLISTWAKPGNSHKKQKMDNNSFLISRRFAFLVVQVLEAELAWPFPFLLPLLSMGG